MLSAIVLAAGMSSRMGKENKLLLPWKGKTIVETVVDELVQAHPGEILVVVGHEKDDVKAILGHHEVTFVENPHFQQGMGTSLVAGIRATHPDSRGFMICLGDLPLIQKTDYQKVIDQFLQQNESNPQAILIPVFKKKWGHPKVFSTIYKDRLLLQSGDKGAKDILRDEAQQIFELPFSHDRILRDIDTKERWKDELGRMN